MTHNYPDGFNNETDYTLCLGFFEAFFHKHILQCCPEFRHTWPIPSAPPALSTDATLDATTDAVALSTAPVALRITAAGNLEEKMVACTRPLWASPSRCVCVCVFVVALVLTILLVVVISYLRGLLSRRGACVHARQLFTRKWPGPWPAKHFLPLGRWMNSQWSLKKTPFWPGSIYIQVNMCRYD